MSEFRQAVGEVAQKSAILESVTAITLWGLAGVEQQVGRIALPNNMERMLTAIRDLLPERVEDEVLREQVRAWTGEARVAYAQRSGILHSVWVGPGDATAHWKASLKPLKGTSPEEMTPADVLAVAHKLDLLATTKAAFLGSLALTVPGPWSVGAS